MSSVTSTVSSPGIISTILHSSVGKKVLVAITGFISFGYVVGHMAGNLQIYMGQDRLNSYAEGLHSLGPLLWIIRLVLLASFITHIWLASLLKLEDWAARPTGYVKKATVKASLSSRTMIYTGLMILAFVVYHILHFTIHVADPSFSHLVDPQGRKDVYSMVIIGFSHRLVSAVYIIAVGLLSYHLSHGVKSMFQSLGLNSESCEKTLSVIGWFFAIIVFLGFISVPIGVMAGWVTLPGGGY